MKKNLLFAGLLLAAIPAFAQKDGPTKTDADPYQIFSQDFEFKAAEGMSEEEAFKAWQQQEIGRIEGVQYYKHKKESGDNLGTNAKPWEKRDEWQRGPWRDTTLILRNDVMVADNPTDSNAMRFDSWRLISADRSAELSKYGITGGEKYFQYVATDTAGAISNQSAWSGHLAARYRRNLFVRGVNIQDTTSYRLTAYVTATKTGEKGNKPTMYFDVMRGHFASEKPFTMGVIDKSSEYKYNRKFEKDVVFEDKANAVYKAGDGNWSKVTFMTYYINDSIADDYVFVDGYWWDAEWSWTSEATGGEEWNYIVQPDKYFVRVGFASDSTTFGIDDISLTKSWIGGCEYNGDKIRVDFGYQTNLSDLCEQAYEKTNISSIEILGDYFEVWGLLDGSKYDMGDEKFWYEVPIRSAEYQKDGYMYMFTDVDEDLFGGEYVDFNVFDSVLVSFKNPVDQPDKKLVYDEKSSFPRAWDVEWIKAGRNVMNFSNEVATPNPLVGEGIYSMKDLPPVFQGGYTYESGSFQMDGTLRSLDFKFSRNIAYDDKGNASNLALMKVQYGSTTELWTVSKVQNDTIVTFERPAGCTGTLVGDVEFTAVQLYGAAKNDHTSTVTARGEDATISYSFGPQPKTDGLVAKVTFEKQKTSKARSKEITLDGFTMSNCYMAISQFVEGSLFNKGLTFGVDPSIGTGASSSNRATLNYAFNVSAQGDYDFSLLFVAHHGSAPKLGVTVYDADGNKVSNIDEYDLLPKKRVEDSVIVNVDTINFTLNAMAAGNYKMSLVLTNSEDGWYMPQFGWYGNADNVTLFSLGIVESGKELPAFLSIGYPYTSAFAAAKATLASAIAKAEVDVNQYGGAAYVAGNSVKSKYADFNSGEDVTAPSAWTAATKEQNASAKAITDRIALVDEMWKQYGLLSDTLAYFAGLELTEMGSYKAAAAALATYENVKGSEITDDSIKAITKICQDAQSEMANQYKVIEPYRATLKAAQDSVAGKYWVEIDAYAALSQAVETAEKFNEVTSTSTEISAMRNELLKALFSYIDVVNRDKVSKLNMAALDSLASKLYTFDGDKRQDIADLLANRQYNRLGTFYKKAIKYAIYDKFVKGEDVDSLPVNALIKNNELYASVKLVDHSDFRWPEKGVINTADENGGNIVIVEHQYNNVPVEIMIQGVEYTDLLLDWTVMAGGSGNRMVTVDDASYSKISSQSFFNGDLGMDWSSAATLTQELEDLPVGMYSVGTNFIEISDNSTVTANDKSIAVAKNQTGNKSVDSLFIADGNLSLKVDLKSNEGWTRIDDMFLTFHADSTANYADLANAALGELNEYPTFADASDEAAADVEYFNLNGIKIDNPKGVVIKVIKKNGKRFSKMVYIK